MGPSTVLVIHSDIAMRESVRCALEGAGYRVRTSDGSDVHLVPDPDLVLLDWRGRERTAALLGSGDEDAPSLGKVIIMASVAAFPEAVSALALGAADCLRLPFEPPELVARVAAALSRPRACFVRETFEAGPIEFDKTAYRLAIHGQALALAPTEFRLLAFFLEHPERVFARAELLRRVWNKPLGTCRERTVDVHVRRLRQVLESFGCDGMIQTVRGFGYRFSPKNLPWVSLNASADARESGESDRSVRSAHDTAQNLAPPQNCT